MVIRLKQPCILSISIIYAIFIEEYKCTINYLRSSQFYAIFIIRCIVSIPSICKCNSIYIGLTVDVNAIEQFATVYTSQLAIVIDYIFMSQSRNCCTPINYRVANFAIGTTGIAVFSAGSFLISHRLFIMDMIGAVQEVGVIICLHIVTICKRLGIDMDLICRECSCGVIKVLYNTLFHFNVYRNIGNIRRLPSRCRIITIVATAECPNTNWQACQNSIA